MNREFLIKMFSPAVEAIGVQHGWLIRWALAKAYQECGGNPYNVLIDQANNCLGIKAGWQAEDGEWHLFGCPVIWLAANTGPEAGQLTPWRVFESLTACFAEFARKINDRTPYEHFRKYALFMFENTYTDHLEGHAGDVFLRLVSVTHELEEMGRVDSRGRIVEDA